MVRTSKKEHGPRTPDYYAIGGLAVVVICLMVAGIYIGGGNGSITSGGISKTISTSVATGQFTGGTSTANGNVLILVAALLVLIVAHAIVRRKTRG